MVNVPIYDCFKKQSNNQNETPLKLNSQTTDILSLRSCETLLSFKGWKRANSQ